MKRKSTGIAKASGFNCADSSQLDKARFLSYINIAKHGIIIEFKIHIKCFDVARHLDFADIAI